MKSLALLLLAAILLTGCAGSYFTFDKAAQVKIGMTEAEVTKIMGRPFMVNALPESTEWIYSYADMGGSRVVKFGFDMSGKVSAVPRIPESFKSKKATTVVSSPKAQ